MIVREASAGYPQTVAALVAAIGRRGLTLFARIDHAGAAREAGLELEPEEVLVFGNPRAGTPLMQQDPRIGYELPLRMLLWQRGDQVFLAYRDPIELAAGYDLAGAEPILEKMGALMAELAAEAAG